MLADFLSPVRSIQEFDAHSLGSVSGVAGGSPFNSEGALSGFVMQRQIRTNWCWAAVTASVLSYFVQPISGLSQCQIASGELAQDCCGSESDKCNIVWYLDRSLKAVGHFLELIEGVVEFDKVQESILVPLANPLCCRIQFVLGGAHFLAISGFKIANDGTQYLAVDDPFFGPTTISYEKFVSSYRSLGDIWTHTYLTTRDATSITGASDSIGPSSA